MPKVNVAAYKLLRTRKLSFLKYAQIILLLLFLWWSNIETRAYGYSTSQASEEKQSQEPQGAIVINPVSSVINDKDPEKIYVLAVNYKTEGTKWHKQSIGSLIPFIGSKPTKALQLNEPVGIAIIGQKGSYNLKISLFFKGELESHCYSIKLTEEVIGSRIDVRIENQWNPTLFCNNKKPKPVEGIFNIRNANLPGKYSIFVNDKNIGDVEYSLESNEVRLNIGGKIYGVGGITQVLLFPRERHEIYIIEPKI